MIWLLGAFVASWVACWCVGWLMRGWVETERARTVPEHPSLKNLRPPRERPRRAVEQRPWRVIEGGLQRPNALYDWQREDWGG